LEDTCQFGERGLHDWRTHVDKVKRGNEHGTHMPGGMHQATHTLRKLNECSLQSARALDDGAL